MSVEHFNMFHCRSASFVLIVHVLVCEHPNQINATRNSHACTIICLPYYYVFIRVTRAKRAMLPISFCC